MKTYHCDRMLKLDPNTSRVSFPTIFEENRVEFVGQIMDVFDDFLEKHNIRIPESDKQNEEENGSFENNPVRLYGDVYSEISDEIEHILYQWHVLEE